MLIESTSTKLCIISSYDSSVKHHFLIIESCLNCYHCVQFKLSAEERLIGLGSIYESENQINIKCFKFSFLASEESYIRQLEIEETYGVKKDDDKKDKEK